jgi:dimethylglycine dehydrogenase
LACRLCPDARRRGAYPDPQEVRRLWPLIENGDRVLGGLYHPQDGHIAAADVTQAPAMWARDKSKPRNFA